MEKKIIAVVSVVVLLATVLAACGKRPTVTLKEGQEYLLATDDEGNTILNDDGELMVYVTDKDGKYVKDDNGERQQNAVTFPAIVANKNVLETPYFVMTYPETWEVNEDGEATKPEYKGTTVSIKMIRKVTEGNTVDTYFNNLVTEEQMLAAQAKEKYPNTTFNVSYPTLTMKGINCRATELKILNEDGTTFYYVREIYFQWSGKIFQISYGIGENANDEILNIDSIINDGLVMRDKGKK